MVNPSDIYDYSSTEKCIESLVKKYDETLSIADVYSSTQGRNICVLKLGKGKQKVLFASAIHGREYVSKSFLLYSTEVYAQKIQKDENIRKMLEDFSFYIVPDCNPDSVEIALGKEKPCVYSEDFDAYTFKDNANGVNINANFPFCWEDVPKSRHKGSCAASEKETQNLINLCEKEEFDKMLSLHSRGGCLYWRDTGNGIIENDQILAQQISQDCGFSLCAVTEDVKAYSGGFENWFRYRFRKPAICVELVKDETAPFEICCRKFFEYTDWCNTKNLFLSAAKANI